MRKTPWKKAWIGGLVLSIGLLPASVSGQWVQVGTDIDGEAAVDGSGESLSLSSNGSRVAIGAPQNLNNGFVRVYQWGGFSWSQLGSDLGGEAAADAFGSSVSLSPDGSRLAVGAPLNDGNGSSSGHVRVYQWVSAASLWVQMGSDIDGEAGGDYSGQSVSLSSDGSRLAIGAPRHDGINGPHSGHVRVYQWVNPDWVLIGSAIEGEAGFDKSGWSVSLSSDGSKLAIGAPANQFDDSPGSVRVYEWGGTSWSQMGPALGGEAAGDDFGSSVSLSSDGSRLAVGAPENDGNGSSSGHVRAYLWVGGVTNWVQLGSDIDGEAEGDEFGSSVSLSSDGSRLAIGAPENSGDTSWSGHTRVYQWGSQDWYQLGDDIDGEAVGNNSGTSVSLSSNGSLVAIGAPNAADGQGVTTGHARIYGNAMLFEDGFESGDSNRWSSQIPSRGP